MSSEQHETQEAEMVASLVVIDLGRNKTSGTIVFDDGGVTPLLIDGRDGLVVRCADDGSQTCNVRITDRLIQLVDQDRLSEAETLSGDLARTMLDGFAATTPVVLSLPAAFGPITESVVVAGFSKYAQVETAIKRPLSSLSACHQVTDGPVLAIDNDGGELGVVAFDGAQRRVFPPAPLSTGPTDHAESVVRRLRSYCRDVAAHLPTTEVVVNDAWPQIAAKFAAVVLSGSGANHPQFRSLIESQFGNDVNVLTTDQRPSAAVLQLGPLHNDWSAGWPTARPVIEDGILRVLADSGERYGLRIGNQLTDGIKVPGDLAPTARLKALPDGRLLLLGEAGRRPLTMRIRWSLTSGSPIDLAVEPVGTRPLELVRPTADRLHQATAS